jgi:hypothetical protein
VCVLVFIHHAGNGTSGAQFCLLVTQCRRPPIALHALPCVPRIGALWPGWGGPAARLTLLFKRGPFSGEAGSAENAWPGALRRTRRAIASEFLCLLFLSAKYRVRVLVRIVSKAHTSSTVGMA